MQGFEGSASRGHLSQRSAAAIRATRLARHADYRTAFTLDSMWSKREEVSYALARRAQLEAMRRPSRVLSESNPCDADPMLVRAALHHGELSSVACPVCASDRLTNLNYVFGEQLGQYSGRIKSTAELDEMQSEFGEFRVRVVEVCPDCGWNHMITTYLLGDGVERRPPRRQKTVEDIYG